MSDLFVESGKEIIEIGEDFDEVDAQSEILETANQDLDARRRLEKMLDEKRLRDELDDFGDY